MNIAKTTLCTLALSLLAAFQVSAQNEATAPANALRIATGKKGKGYSKLFANINAVCGDKVALSEVETEGGLQNLTALAANQADLGFAQIDTLQDLNASDDAIAALQAVLPLNMNLLHILADSEGFDYKTARRLGGLMDGKTVTVQVTNFSDLKGLPVAVVGSARALGRVLDRGHDMGIQFVDVDTDEQGLAKLQDGKVAALFSTSGWPSGPVQKLKRASGLRLVKFDMPAKPPYQLVKKNYENLDTFNHSFLAAPNLLLTRPFSATGANGRAVANLQSCIQKNLVNLQDGQFEPAWRDVKNTSDTFGWQRFAGGKR